MFDCFENIQTGYRTMRYRQSEMIKFVINLWKEKNQLCFHESFRQLYNKKMFTRKNQ